MLFNGRNSFNQVGNPPYFFYGNPIDVLSNFRVSYHCTKDEKRVTTYDTTKLKYDKLKSLSSKESQGYNDFLLARFGAQGASFFALEQRKIESKMIFSNLTNKEKAKRIDNNTSDIESIINELSNNVSNSGKPISKLITDDLISMSLLIKATVSTEEVLRQINLESEKYIEFIPEKPPKQDDEETNYPHRPPVDIFPDEKEDEPSEEEKPSEPVIKPELPPDAIFIDIKSEEKIVLGLDDKTVLRFVTNAYNTGVSHSHQDLVNVDFNTFMTENGGYEFLITSTKRMGESYITIKAWNDDNSILEKRINVTVREEQMSDKYPIITDADENGIKWLIKSEGAEPKPLYPPFFIEWEKLLYQEKQRIPASILILKHKQEMTVNGVIVDENGRKQYAPTYKYIEEMSRDEIEDIPFSVLGQKERLAFYGDALGNIAFRDEVYYKPDFKPWTSLSLEEKKKIDFEMLYLEHKKEVYGDKNGVIIGPNGVNYYPPKYKAWTDLTPDEKYEIDKKILQQKDKEEIYDEAGNKVLKTSLRVSPNRLILSEEKGQMVGAFEVNTNASTYDFTISNPELLTAVKTGNKLIVSPNGANKDVEVSIVITAQAQGQQLSKETVNVFIDFIDEIPPIDPDDPNPPEEEVKIVVSPNVVSVKENETGRFSYYVSNGKEPKIEVADITRADFFKNDGFITVIGKIEGKTTISLTVYNDDGTEEVAKLEIPVLIEKASEDPQNVLEIDTTPLTLDIGDIRQLSVKSNDANYTVKSTDPEVISVEKKDFIITITALKNGRADILFTANKATGKEVAIQLVGYVNPPKETEEADTK